MWELAPKQGPKAGAPESIEHSKFAPASELKVKVGVESLVRPEGPESMDTTGAVVSTVQVELAGSHRRSRPGRPPGLRIYESRRRARRGCAARCRSPSPPPGSSRAGTGSAPRRSHRYRCRRRRSSPGAVGQRRRAGVDRGGRRGGVDGPGRARRGRVDVPGLVDRPDFEGVGAVGEPRIGLRAGAGGEGGAVIARHWKLATPEPPVSVPEKVKLAEALLVSAGGPESIEVVGAVVSTVQVERPGSRRCSRPGRPPGLRRCGSRRRAPIGLRRGAARQGGARRVEPALEARHARATGVGAGEGEAAEARWSAPAGRSRSRWSARWCRRSRSSSPGSRRCSRPGRPPGLRRCGSRRRARRGCCGEVQAAQSAAWVESSRHWKLATPEPPVSVPEKVKLARGAVGQRRRAGVDRGGRRGGVDGPGRARRGRVDVPGLVDRPDFEFVGAVGERGIGCAARCRLPQSAAWVESSRHWNDATPEPPVSVPEKVKLAEELLVSAGGPDVDLGLSARSSPRRR